ncbi:methionyl-tRNA formyltransferase, partial [Pseudokineococcus basanitobsidens]
WRGAAPVQHALIAGDATTGACVFRLEEGLDTGPVLGRLTERVGPRDTAGDLLERLAPAGADLLVETLDALEDGRGDAVPQPADGVVLAPKLRTEDARVRWEVPADDVDRRVRGCTPAPGAWTTVRGERLRLQPVEPAAADVAPLPPGRLAVTRDAVLVGTGTTPVRLTTVQPAGRRPMAARDWARGLRPTDDEQLGDEQPGDDERPGGGA